MDNNPRRELVDNFSKQVIFQLYFNLFQLIFQLYSEKKLPTVRLIQDMIKDSINISDTTLRKVLYEMGFCWRRTTDDRRVVIEKKMMQKQVGQPLFELCSSIAKLVFQ